MNLEVLAVRAARELRDSAQVDTEHALTSLQALHRRRAVQRRSLVVAAAAAAALSAWVVQPWTTAVDDRPEPLPTPPSFVPLEDGYDVMDTDLTRSGVTEVVATLREGLPSVVLVRDVGNSSFDVVWSSPTEHELGGGLVPWPAAVAWAPDDSQIAIVVARERKPREGVRVVVDLSLVTVNRDGTGRRTVGDVGACRCADALPAMTWKDDRITVDVPDGPDQGDHTMEMS